MVAGPLFLGGKVGYGEEAMGSRETVFTFPDPSAPQARGSAEAEQRAGGTASTVLFLVDKIKDACVAIRRRGRHGALGSSNCLLLLSLQAYWWHFNPVDTRIAPRSIILLRLKHLTLTSKVATAFPCIMYHDNLHQRSCKADRVENKLTVQWKA